MNYDTPGVPHNDFIPVCRPDTVPYDYHGCATLGRLISMTVTSIAVLIVCGVAFENGAPRASESLTLM